MATISSRLTNTAVLASLLWMAEVVASFFCWGGAPLDALPDPHFDFWYLEGLRLRYWALTFLCAGLLWAIVLFWIARYVGDTATDAQHSFKKVTGWLTGIGLAVAAELLTSLSYQQRLPFGLSFGMSAWDLHLYMRQHLVAWTSFLLVCLGAWTARKHWPRKGGRQAPI